MEQGKLSLSIIAVLTAAVSVGVVSLAARPLRQTTLFTAWSWSLAFSLAGFGMALLDSVLGVLSCAWGEILWYLTAIIGLCPAVAVLGARRPVDRVWNLFVILPLLAVLGWPVLTVLMHGLSPRVLQLQAPPLAAFGLVLTMSYGNYVGTRFRFCILLAASGQALLLAPLVGGLTTGPFSDSSIRPLGLICIGAGAILARRLALKRCAPPEGLDRVWHDFRNSFGVVWARRIMDRFEQQAEQQQLRARLLPGGFIWDGDPARQQYGQAESERIMRWLLRRFVDEEWIDARLSSSRSR